MKSTPLHSEGIFEITTPPNLNPDVSSEVCTVYSTQDELESPSLYLPVLPSSGAK